MPMTIEKAIEILDDNIKAQPSGTDCDYFNAVRLSIEALKRIDRQRHNNIPVHQPPLPGEAMF